MSDEKSSFEETKKCPHCSEQINKAAKKCKHCGADLRNWINRHPIWTVVLALVAISTFLSAISSSSSTLSNSTTSNSQGTVASIEIVSIDTKVTESNSVWWKYSWVLVLKNNSTRNKTINATLKWVDTDGFVIDTDWQYGLSVPAGQEATFNDFALIDSSVAGNVNGIEVEID